MNGTDRPTPEQQRAAAPGVSVWVSASAGAGKTRVLTDRLLRLMLDGTDPARILCLTFTRAAAAEMANRLNLVLADWATLPSGLLARKLKDLTGTHADETVFARARQLFARVLDTPGGIKIATIHAFCQTVLRRFPFEADIAPEFAVVEERGANEALAEAAESVILAARDGADGLPDALATVSRHAAEQRFTELMTQLAAERLNLRRLPPGGAALRRRLCAMLALPEEKTSHTLTTAFCTAGAGDEEGLRAAAAALAAGSKTDRDRAPVIAGWCEEPQRRAALLNRYLRAFLSDDAEILTRLVTGATAQAASFPIKQILQVEAERAKTFRDARAAAVVVEATTALAACGAALVGAYDERKRARGLLDYDDLVDKALALLRDPGRAPWVMFKLDGGLDHILIDEAQDTNPEQWEIAAALAEEFFAGQGAGDRGRTIFAVGDAKQSIYSFQRADPRAFLKMRGRFERRVSAANQAWQRVPLEISFRSAPPVLRAVDAIFAHAGANDGVALGGERIRHIASREGQAGLVELWPPIAPEPTDTDDADALPIARVRTAEPRTRLAEAIAATIARWLGEGERLTARGRPVRAGDVMVLVRRRNAFFGDLLRALKRRRVPVAGADRLLLTRQLAVEDLIALGRFLLFPDDDLTLATVLKGPLFEVDEDTLFDLAHGRGRERLWARLRARAADSARLREVVERLGTLLARVDFVPPYELYAEILGALGGRHALAARLGPEAEDPVEEFLGLALAYEREHVPSLQGFLRWVDAGDTEVKRDFAARQRDEVRVLTVHGAKGLQAPVVFVPDTMALPKPPDTLLWDEREKLPLWCPPGNYSVHRFQSERDAVKARNLQEYRRLLYVALTRAEDRLYICGWQTRQKPDAGCWYELCRAGLAGIAAPFSFDARPLLGTDGWSGDGLRVEGEQTLLPAREDDPGTTRAIGPLPGWAMRPPPREPDPPRPLIPSRPSEAEPAALSPLAAAGRDRFKRGLLVHRLLQSLPELPAAERDAAAQQFLALPAHRLPAEAQEEIRRETLAVLGDPEFAPLFGPGSQAEVPLVGLIGGHALSGQIDRLVVAEDRVLIVDYKTLRPPPESEREVAPVYLRQLAIYRAALERIYPGREIRCALLWTDGPRLMPVSPERLAAYLP